MQKNTRTNQNKTTYANLPECEDNKITDRETYILRTTFNDSFKCVENFDFS